MDNQRFTRVADAHPLAFRVDDDASRHVQVGTSVDIDVAVSIEVLDDWHRGFRGHSANQAFAASGNRHIDVFIQAKEIADGLSVRGVDQLDEARRKPHSASPLPGECQQSRDWNAWLPCRPEG